jgi:di/tricarboxylate transporter
MPASTRKSVTNPCAGWRVHEGGMTFDQCAILVLLTLMLAAFAVERFRIELVAIGGLALAWLSGLVSTDMVFSGFANPAFITVVEILLIIQVIARARILDALAERISGGPNSRFRIVVSLSAITALLSVFMNNIGAFVLMLPVAISVCRASGLDPREALIPVSFAALLGGLCSAIGTPANLLVSQSLLEATGQGFAFFEFAFVGIPVACAGLLVIAWRRPSFRRLPKSGEPPPEDDRLVITELRIPPGSPLRGKSRPEAEEAIRARFHSVLRDGKHLFGRPGEHRLNETDLLVAEMSIGAYHAAIASGVAVPAIIGQEADTHAEAVIVPESTLVGSRIGSLDIFHARQIAVDGVMTRNPRIEGRLTDIRLGIGDVLLLRGEDASVADAIEQCDALLLQPRQPRSAATVSWRPLGIFAAGIAAASAGLAPPEIAFGMVVLFLALAGQLRLRTALAALDWPILLMLAAMIPLGLAVQTTGAASVIADAIAGVLPSASAFILALTMLGLAVLITPFVNNASTAIILAPIALELSSSAGVDPHALLMAVAIGASLDFMTPFGHHNNALAMSIGGYRFLDFPRSGWLLSAVSVAIAGFAIGLFWI